MAFIQTRPAKEFLPKTSGACWNQSRVRGQKVGAVHLNRLQAIEVNCPYPLRKRQPRRGYRALDKEERWILRDQTSLTQPIRSIPNALITLSWKRSKSRPKVKIVTNACESCDRS